MAKVKLNDVAIEARETWKQSKTDVPVVGLEHLEPDEIWLKRWDLNPDENTFTKGFKKGQLLFGRRRAYQKKMSVASCDGICSGDITVIAAKPEKILPDLLPFYLRTDAFFDFAVRGSGGSLSPRVKWSHISDYEFDLPPMEEQKKLAELLWAANDLKEKYKKAITATDEMLKAKFREMFGCVGNGDGFNAEAQRLREGESGLAAKNAEVAKSKWPVVRLEDICVIGPQNGFYKKGAEKNGTVRVLKMTQLFAHESMEDAKDCDMWAVGESDLSKFRLTPNDLVFGRRSLVPEGAGKCRRVGNISDDMIFESSMIRVTLDPNKAFPRYIQMWTESIDGEKIMAQMRSGTTVFGIRGSELKALKIPLPPLALQCEFVAIAEKAEAAKTALKKSIADIDQVMMGLIS